MRLAGIVKALIVVAVATRLRRDFHGPPIDYLTLAAAAFVSWVGVPGPGEPVLIAAGVLAAHHKLDIAGVVAVAFAAAAAGGVVGWLLGMKAGRVVLTARGPLHRARHKALEKGDEVFLRYAALAVFLTPSWVAGIHRVRPGLFMVINAGGAALWAVGIGLGAYFVGPSVIDFVSELGWITGGALIVLIIVVIVDQLRRRRRRQARTASARPG